MRSGGTKASSANRVSPVTHFRVPSLKKSEIEKMEVKKYMVVAKVPDGRFVRYRVNNLVRFAEFLDRRFGGFRYFNVYRYTRAGDGEQLANFTCNKRPTTPYLLCT